MVNYIRIFVFKTCPLPELLVRLTMAFLSKSAHLNPNLVWCIVSNQMASINNNHLDKSVINDFNNFSWLQNKSQDVVLYFSALVSVLEFIYPIWCGLSKLFSLRILWKFWAYSRLKHNLNLFTSFQFLVSTISQTETHFCYSITKL